MSSTSEPLPGLAVAGDRGRRDARVISIVAVAHFVSHVHIMLLPPILLNTLFKAGVLLSIAGWKRGWPAAGAPCGRLPLATTS